MNRERGRELYALPPRTKLSSGATAAGCALDLVGVLAGVAVAEVSLSALEVVLTLDLDRLHSPRDGAARR